MKFFQVLVTDRYKTSINKKYTHVFNYSSLTEALKTLKLYEYINAADGVTLTDPLSGEELCQFRLAYEEKGAAVIELRHEFFGIPEGCTTKQVTHMKSVYIKEINL